MATTTTTPLMNLVLPIPGPTGEPGPTYATDLVTALNVVDSHTHASGSGSQITPAGLNINTDFSINLNNLTNILSVRLNNGSVLAGTNDKNCLYASGGNLFYNNASGTSIQLTAAGAINVASVGTITGDYSTSSAALAYSNTSKSYQFLQGTPNTSFSASIVSGPISITEPVASGNAVTLKTVTSLGSSITLTLPGALPASNLPVSLDNSGNLTAAQIQTAQIANLAVTTALIAAAAVTNTQLATSAVGQANLAARATGSTVGAGGIATSSNITFVGSGTTATNVTNASVTITTTGRPVKIFLQPTGSTASSISTAAANGGDSTFTILRGGSVIASFETSWFAGLSGANATMKLPCSVISFTDPNLAAGTYTYTMQAFGSSSGTSQTVSNATLVAYEI